MPKIQCGSINVGMKSKQTKTKYKYVNEKSSTSNIDKQF